MAQRENADCGYFASALFVQFNNLRVITILASSCFQLSGQKWAPAQHQLTHRLLLELPQPDNQQQNVKEKQRKEDGFYR